MSSVSPVPPAFTQYFEGPATANGNAVLVTAVHGFGREPKAVQLVAVCTVANNGYAIGDVAIIANSNEQASAVIFYEIADITTIARARTRNVVNGLSTAALNKTTGALFSMAAAQWDLHLRCWA